ncbi:tetratricopeptide repeat protein [Streptomyces sp. NPDC001985]|uniref:AfsR/SARP family transcriptional regulator n=1 Tax=Streptomyces sp. NPDC001985 TaxID=3154406 RepID=UPI00332133E3
MEAHVLGPVRVEVGGRRVVQGRTKLAALFAALITSPGCRAGRTEIETCVWPDERVPDDRLPSLMTALRKKLEVPLERGKSSAYSINLPWESTDYLRFREFGRRSGAPGLSWQERFGWLSRAMDEWGCEEPLHGLPGPGFDDRRTELRIEWREALLRHLAAAHRSDELDWLRNRTEGLLAQCPEDWPVFRFHLLARPELSQRSRFRLYTGMRDRSGPPGDRELEEEIKRLVKRASVSRGGSDRSERAVPRQLPAAGRSILGRESLLAGLRETLVKKRADGVMALVVLSGMPGVGKSALARHLAAEVASEFTDGALHADLRGFAGLDIEPASPDQILDGFLAALEVKTRATGPENKAAALRTHLANRSVLILLDDAADAEQVRPLLPGDGSCAVIITSRSSLDGLHASEGVCLTQIDPLDGEDAAALLNDALTPESAEANRDSVAELVGLCGRLPLALSVIARRITRRPSAAIRALVVQMREERNRLRAMDLPDDQLSVMAALHCSVGVRSPAAKCLLWQLAVHPGPSIDWSAAVDLGRAGAGGDVDRALEELSGANLVELRDDRYHLHDLVRVLARHHMDSHIDRPLPALREKTLSRVFEYQLQHTWACDRVIDSNRVLPVPPVSADMEVYPPQNDKEAMRLLDAEYETVTGGIELAIQKGYSRYAWLLSMVLITYQWRRGLYIAVEHNLTRVENCRDITAPSDWAMFHRMLAGSREKQKKYAEAADSLRTAVLLGEQDDSDPGRLSLARSLHALALTLRRLADPEGAAECHRRALDLFRTLGNRVGEAGALNGIGTLHHDRGEYDDALRQCTEARWLFEATTDRNGLANVLTTLGKIHLSRSERDRALTMYERAVDLYRELGNWSHEATALERCADILVSAGRAPDAVRALERVVVLLERLGGEGVRNVLDRLDGLR